MSDAGAVTATSATAASATAAIASIEQLLADAEHLPDPRARALARSLAAALVDLVGAGLTRVLALGDVTLARALADDELVGNLLVLCGLHPDAPEVRAARALAAATAELGAAGVTLDEVAATAELGAAGVTLDEVAATAGGSVRVRVSAARGGAGEPDRVRHLIETIVLARAPDAEAIVVELGGQVLAPAGFVSAARLRVTP